MTYDVIMPCLNEEATVAACIAKAKEGLASAGVQGAIIVADNGSSDSSIVKAKAAGAQIVHVEEKGYGSALLGAIRKSSADYIIMADADDSYDFRDIPLFVSKLSEGYELVMGNRFRGGIEKDAMPFMHKYVGNPLLSSIGKLLYTDDCDDFHCGMRAFRRSSITGLGLSSPGMEFASEMIIKASKAGLRIAEVPIRLYKDGRGRPSHLRTYRDGLRHLFVLVKYKFV